MKKVKVTVRGVGPYYVVTVVPEDDETFTGRIASTRMGEVIGLAEFLRKEPYSGNTAVATRYQQALRFLDGQLGKVVTFQDVDAFFDECPVTLTEMKAYY